MKSSKNEYRIVTAYGGNYGYEWRRLSSDYWSNPGSCYQSIDAVKDRLKELMAIDDFIPQIVEIPE